VPGNILPRRLDVVDEAFPAQIRARIQSGAAPAERIHHQVVCSV
jgi:hypothetical protein